MGNKIFVNILTNEMSNFEEYFMFPSTFEDLLKAQDIKVIAKDFQSANSFQTRSYFFKANSGLPLAIIVHGTGNDGFFPQAMIIRMLLLRSPRA